MLKILLKISRKLREKNNRKKKKKNSTNHNIGVYQKIKFKKQKITKANKISNKNLSRDKIKINN